MQTVEGNRRVGRVGAVLAAMLLAAGIGVGDGGAARAAPGRLAETTSATTGTSVGQRAPSFRLTAIDGRAVADGGARPKVLFFMAAWCLTCIPEEQALARLHRKYGGRVDIVTIDVDVRNDTVADLKNFQSRYGGPWPHVLNMQMAMLFRIRSLDTTYVLNRHNVVTYRDAVPTDFATLEREVLKVLPARDS